MPPLSEDGGGGAVLAAGAGGGGGPAPSGPAPSGLVTAIEEEAQSEEFLTRWGYVAGPSAFADELGEMVRKCSPGEHLV